MQFSSVLSFRRVGENVKKFHLCVFTYIKWFNAGAKVSDWSHFNGSCLRSGVGMDDFAIV